MKEIFISLWRNKIIWHCLVFARFLKNPFNYIRRKRMPSLREAAISRDQQEHIQLLAKNGHSRIQILPNQQLLKELDALIKSRSANERERDRTGLQKNYLWSLSKEEDLKTSTIPARMALQEWVLDIATAHIGQTAYLHNIQMVEAFKTDNEEWIGTQLLHQDYPDTRMVKLFIYFSDVQTTEDGPFSIIPPQYTKAINGFKEQKEKLNSPSRVRDQELASHRLTDKIIEICGDSHTAFFADTGSCFHYGGRVSSSNKRLTYIATYAAYNTFPFSKNGLVIDSPLDNYTKSVVNKNLT